MDQYEMSMTYLRESSSAPSPSIMWLYMGYAAIHAVLAVRDAVVDGVRIKAERPVADELVEAWEGGEDE